jgi:5-methyltetrahydropteroyltriglutamate--homocysteine methyltransferase
MPELVSTTPGLYPLPDWAKDDLQDLKGNQREDLIGGDESDEIVETYATVREELVESQAAAGLDRIVEGQGRWDDMLAHPLTVHDSVETGGIVRYYDNNNFYRDPVVTGELTPDGDVAAELDAAAEHAAGPVQAVLPGPYSLADLATDEQYGDEAAFLDAVGAFLAGEAGQFPEVETLFLLEPSLVTAPPEDDDTHERVPEAIDTVAGALDAEVVVYPYWGALPEKTYAYVMDADIDALGFDLVSAPDENVYNAQEYGTPDDVALGVVDGQNTRVESAETVRERVEWFDGRTPQNDYGRVYATTSTETFYLPVNRFEQKLDALGAATQADGVSGTQDGELEVEA